MPEFIAGSPNQNVWAINNSGAGAIGAYSGGTIYPLLVDDTGRLMTTAMIGSLTIGSVSANVDSIYVQSGANIDLGSAWTTVGSVYVVNNVSVIGTVGISTDPLPVSGAYFPGSNVWLESLPTDSAMNNPYINLEYISSGAGTGIDTGSAIGSITQFVGAGSYVKSLTYSNNNLVNIGSWT